jgi:hypothetical protein
MLALDVRTARWSRTAVIAISCLERMIELSLYAEEKLKPG